MQDAGRRQRCIEIGDTLPRTRRKPSTSLYFASSLALGFVIHSGLATARADELVKEDREHAAPAASDDGARWAFAPLERPALPGVSDPDWCRGPIDAFVLARLDAAGLSPAPEAERRVLIRRASYDLTGLPPTPEEVRAFVADSRPDAWERLVDRLIESPAYGERAARRWMDLVHFAETHGHDEDAIRENAWPYRDWLIASFNADEPWSRFIEKQVAGDVLFPGDPWATVATGLLAAGPWDGSSQMGIQDGTVDKEIARYLDRDDMIATVIATFSSVTVNCARCHDHKFDPIPQSDYYALQAVFAGVDRVDRPFDADPVVTARRRELELRLAGLRASTDDNALLATPEARRELDSLEGRIAEEARRWEIADRANVEVHAASGSTLTRLDDGSFLASGGSPEVDVYTFEVESGLDRVGALRVEVLPDPSLPAGGPGRALNGNLHLSEVRVRLLPGSAAAAPVEARIGSALADFDQSGWTIAHAIDGRRDTAWGVHPEEGRPHAAIFVLDTPLSPIPGARVEVTLEQSHGRGHTIGRVRIALSSAADIAVATPLPAEIDAALRRAPSERSTAELARVARFLIEREIASEIAALPPPGQVFSVASDFEPKGNYRPARGPRPVHLLRRGDVRSPREEATPGALSAIAVLPSRFDLADPRDEGARRAALARWLSHPENVLTWRSIANRIWQVHFETGIVATPNDFGRSGERPSHPQLLDWLAVELRDGGGSIKALHRSILASAAYRQAWRHDDRGTAIDPENRLLWRAPLRRLDAEGVRDTLLAISDELDRRMGGPSARQFHARPGVHVAPIADYESFESDRAENRRRGVYRFVFRTQADPWFEALDCPDASQLAPRRSTDPSVFQALALLNHRLHLALFERLAARIERETKDAKEQARRLFELAIGREPEPEESADAVAYIARHGLEAACRWIASSSELLWID
jgi:hypothetical protein